MLGSYRRLLAHSDVREAFAVSLLGRLPIGMVGLALLLLVQLSEASYASFGFVTSAYIAGLPAAAPMLGRLIDRHGPNRIPVEAAFLDDRLRWLRRGEFSVHVHTRPARGSAARRLGVVLWQC
jgi:MFS family permease